MSTLRTILEVIRETALYCSGSPHSRTRQLAALRRLDPHLLRDIGLTTDEAKQGYRLRSVKPQQPATAVQLGRLTWNR